MTDKYFTKGMNCPFLFNLYEVHCTRWLRFLQY